MVVFRDRLGVFGEIEGMVMHALLYQKRRQIEFSFPNSSIPQR